jgi:hypothetical protein
MILRRVLPNKNNADEFKSSSICKLTGCIAITFLLIMLAFLSGCANIMPSVTSPPPSSDEPPVITSISPPQESEITFLVEIPDNTPPDQPISINLLDEVTGLAINTKTHPIERVEDGFFSTTLPFPLGSIVKYRYSRQGEAATVEEHISDGRQLRYRLYHVEGPGEVQDVVTRWTDTKFEGTTGRITGKALDSITGQPIPNMLIVAGGAQALTSSDGSYLLEGLPPATHNLVAYALDGSYQIFQQGALVEAESTTPAELRLNKAEFVNVTFEISVPGNTIPAVPIRLAGNLYQLGNTFADLSGGVSTMATRMPVLNLLPDQSYQISLTLPIGADVRYLYTLGDSLWNPERTLDGEIQLRQIIIPDHDIKVSDQVESWATTESSTITFDVTVPDITPPDEYVAIQYKPFYGWTESIPMWSLGNNRWAYVLNTSTNLISGLSYRYCRNNQCGSKDDLQTMGNSSTGNLVNSDISPQTIVDQVESWAWLDPLPTLSDPGNSQINPRGADYFAGIELQAAYHPSWTPLNPFTINEIQKTGANWIVLSPTWSYTRDNPPILEQVTGRDALWFDLTASTQQAQESGFKIALNPTPQFPTTINEWWSNAPRDFSWWLVWFERYRNFAIHHADLAAQTNADVLVLGGEWLSPALPGGTLSDGSPSGVPADADIRWRTIIQDIRSRYSGTLAWAISPSQILEISPSFLEGVDLIYLQFSPPLSNQLDPAQSDLEAEAARILDNDILPLQTELGKPLILSVAYPSADGGNTACLDDPNSEECLEFSALSPPNEDIPSIALDLEEQTDIYNALLNVSNNRDWISGFVSSGYYPPAALQDKSISIHGKPAEEAIRHWFPQLVAETTQ